MFLQESVVPSEAHAGQSGFDPWPDRSFESTLELSRSAMRVWHIRSFGLDALEQVESPIPQPGPHQLLVRVGAVSLNYRDRLVIDGTFIPELALPFVPASDAAGEVVAVGAEVTRFRVGQRVVGAFVPRWTDGNDRDGDA